MTLHRHPRQPDLVRADDAEVPLTPVRVVPDFASRLQCLLVVHHFERHVAEHGPTGTGDGFFDHRVMYIDNFPDEANHARQILQLWRYKAEALVSRAHGLPLWSDTVHVVRWEDGLGMPPHQDDRHPDPDEPHFTPWREVAGLIYLNDDYREGEIYFPELGVQYKPVAGSFVFFPGDLWHGVRPGRGGVRYTSPQWFTRDRDRRDRYADVIY